MDVMRTVRNQCASRCPTTSRRGLALTALCSALLAVSVAMANVGDPATGGPAIPPGEERLIEAMLGRGTRIGKCKLIKSRVEYTVITAIYKCRDDGRVTLELCHPMNATAPSIQTGQFAITLESGSPSLGLLDALVSRIRPREADFVWTWAEHAPVENDAEDLSEVRD